VNVWILTRTDWDYEETESLIVSARSEDEARAVANRYSVRRGHRYAGDWLQPAGATCVRANTRTAGVIYEDTHPG
jgi:hypothetical protein